MTKTQTTKTCGAHTEIHEDGWGHTGGITCNREATHTVIITHTATPDPIIETRCRTHANRIVDYVALSHNDKMKVTVS